VTRVLDVVTACVVGCATVDDVRLGLLGPPTLLVGGRAVDVETRKAIALLAYVVVEGPQRRDTLDALLWPTSDARRARQALRRTLSALRKVLPDGALADGDDVALAVAVGTDLARADELFRGDVLEGLHFRDADPFEHWRRDTAQRIGRRHARLLERWCNLHVAAHEFGAAVEVARRRLALDPLHEPSHQQLMLLHAWQGDRAAAARQFAACTRVLDEELGVAPLPRTVALDRAVRAGTVDPPPARTPSVAPAPAADAATNTRGASEDARHPGARTQAPPPAPLVGRDVQLAEVLDLCRVCTTDGAVAMLVGEAGIGKTRLADEVVAAVEGPLVRVTANRGEASLAYAPVAAALRRGADAIEHLDESVVAEVARLVPDAVDVRPPAAGLDSPAARTRFVGACATALLEPLSRGDGPGLLVVEDLDEADRETRELVAYVTRRLEGRPVLLLVTCREAVRGIEPRLRLDLERLTRDEVAELAAARDARDVADRLHAESEGVPFLVVSYLDARTAGDDGWALPADGRDLVRGRLGRLDEVARQVLAAAAILGAGHGTELLEQVSGRSEDEVVGAVEQLAASGIVAVDDDGDCRLTHDKLRTVVLDDTSPVRRRLLHRRAAVALAASSPPVAAATLAHHLERAGREEEAATAHGEAGRHAARLYANDDAIAHCEAALAMGHPDHVGLLLLLGDLRVRTGDYAGAAQRYTRASAHAADPALVEQRLGALAVRRGHDEVAVAHLRRALDAGPTGELLVRTLAPLAQALSRRGELADAAAVAARAVAAADDVEGGTAAIAHNVAGLVARRRGDLAAARSHLRASLAAAHGPEQRAAALNNLAHVLGEAGELDEALVVAREALSAGLAAGDRHREAALLSNLADLLHAHGRTQEALELQGRAAERFAGVGETPTLTPEIWRLVDW
jgi:DNA-binding SARP family transcriptional activator/tetratricopeptide (TPR) repeat protein